MSTIWYYSDEIKDIFWMSMELVQHKFRAEFKINRIQLKFIHPIHCR